MGHLAAHLERSAARFPDSVAVVGPEGRSLSYAELDRQSNQVASFLLSVGVEPGDRVGLIMAKSTRAVVVLFGVLKARAAYVPVDWCAPVERNGAIVRDCDVRVLFVDSRLEADLAPMALAETLVSVPLGGAEPASKATPWSTVLAQPAAAVESGQRRRDELAFILYTSGSTGTPKGVMLTHENADAFVRWSSETFRPTRHDQFSSHAPFHFDLSVFDIHVALGHGACVHLISRAIGQSPRRLASFIAERRISIWYSAPSVLAMMAQYGKLDSFESESLRMVLFAGEVFPVKHLRRLVALWPHPRYYNLYGPTETNVCTYAPVPTPIPEARVDPYPIGPACAHCEALVLDEHGEVVERGREGMLYIAGPSVSVGYWKRPEEDLRFIQRDGQRYYNTGDVVRESAGEGFVYVGRRDRMVKRNGNRIELGEIESALYRSEEVEEAAVVSLTGPEGVRITACVVVESSGRPSLLSFKSFCARALPSYMQPDDFVFLDRLPKTSTDKTDYQALARFVVEL